MTLSFDLDHLRGWIGRTESRDDTIGATPVAALAATLDRERIDASPGAPLPPLWHWLYFLPTARGSELGPDGHPARGGFLPPVPLPRRMWAGSRLAWHAPLAIGDAVRRVSTVEDVSAKTGRSGELCFVKVRHRVEGPRGLAVDELHDIVYRGLAPAEAAGTAAPDRAAASADPAASAAPAAWQRDVVPDDVLLFRYSALTFNGHRIHYDRRYATQVEGYPGLVVHGPLMATLLMELATARDARPVARFAFRAMGPVFDTAPFAVCGEPDGADAARLWIRGPAGETAMQAEVEFARAHGQPTEASR